MEVCGLFKQLFQRSFAYGQEMILPFQNTSVSLSHESALSLKLLKKTFFNSEVLLIFWQWLWSVVQVMATAERSEFKQLVLTLW